ncbi:hypothetical protein [Ruminiclostridium cellobioparum]|uniref:hypothetical protein n=1 Tax=Ruminiclostridium cellobioparum TaxID=29355 RepID=UPI0028A6B002|nr:hypothetical protein [Ruminiclostridium cellobioparum]
MSKKLCSVKIENFLQAMGINPLQCKSPNGWYGINLSTPVQAKLFFHPMDDGLRLQVVPLFKQYRITRASTVNTHIGVVAITPGESNPYIISELDIASITNEKLNEVTGYILSNIDAIIRSVQ